MYNGCAATRAGISKGLTAWRGTGAITAIGIGVTGPSWNRPCCWSIAAVLVILFPRRIWSRGRRSQTRIRRTAPATPPAIFSRGANRDQFDRNWRRGRQSAAAIIDAFNDPTLLSDVAWRFNLNADINLQAFTFARRPDLDRAGRERQHHTERDDPQQGPAGPTKRPRGRRVGRSRNPWTWNGLLHFPPGDMSSSSRPTSSRPAGSAVSTAADYSGRFRGFDELGHRRILR